MFQQTQVYAATVEGLVQCYDDVLDMFSLLANGVMGFVLSQNETETMTAFTTNSLRHANTINAGGDPMDEKLAVTIGCGKKFLKELDEHFEKFLENCWVHFSRLEKSAEEAMPEMFQVKLNEIADLEGRLRKAIVDEDMTASEVAEIYNKVKGFLMNLEREAKEARAAKDKADRIEAAKPSISRLMVLVDRGRRLTGAMA